MKILSWNIWIDCNFDELKKYLKESNADIIGLQEVKDDDSEREVINFLEGLGYYSFFACTEQLWDGKKYRHGPAIFSKFPIIHSEKIQLETGDGERAAAFVKVDIQGKILNVFSTHLVHTHQKPSVEQEEQVTRLIEKLPQESTILMGDFNAEPESRTIQALRNIMVDTDPKELPTWSTNKDGCKTCGVSGVTIKLDYIFVSKDISFDSFEVKDSMASDHLPVSVNVEV